MLKKMFLILIILCTTCLFSGCTTNKLHDKIVYKNNDFLCIDGVEYLVIGIGYRGYMAPHYKIDRFDNPKLIKCEVENEKFMD